MNNIPEWLVNLESEDISFIKKFLLASGSLKEVAKNYHVTYPTLRLRLDRLIEKIKINDQNENEPYIALIKKMALDDKINMETAKILVSEYKRRKK